MNQAKFDALEEYRTSPLFSDAERALLDYVTELTKEKKVSPETFVDGLDHTVDAFLGLLHGENIGKMLVRL